MKPVLIIDSEKSAVQRELLSMLIQHGAGEDFVIVDTAKPLVYEMPTLSIKMYSYGQAEFFDQKRLRELSRKASRQKATSLEKMELAGMEKKLRGFR